MNLRHLHRSTPRRRAAIKMLACIMLGCLTAIGVAWGIALWGVETSKAPVETEGLVLRKDAEIGILCTRTSGALGHVEYVVLTSPDVFYQAIALNAPSAFPLRYSEVSRPWRLPTLPNCVRTEHHFGWPMTCLHGSVERKTRASWDGLHRENILCVRSDLATAYPSTQYAKPFHRRHRDRSLSVPTGIRAVGLVVNSACYASVWWLLLTVPGFRGRWRQRRGLCVSCGYDLRATPTNMPCPECGVSPKQPLPTTLTT